MKKHRFIFLGGLHRSGTSLLHEILRSHPEISGFSNTGVTQDEGMFLQSVYPSARKFGGPGKFGFKEASFMDENHPLATATNARKLFQQWSKYWDLDKDYLIEKSPPNLVRTRFLQKLFPNSMFIIVLRHPIAVSYATRKWSKTGIPSLIENSLRCYERFLRDMPYLERVYVLRYEEFVNAPLKALQSLLNWIGIHPVKIDQEVRTDVNGKYFRLWQADRENFIKKNFLGFKNLPEKYEKRFNVFGYSIKSVEAPLPLEWPGPQS